MPSRRSILQSSAIVFTVGPAGCLSPIEGGPEGSADLILVNKTDSPVSVTVTVTDKSGATPLSETFDVPVVEGHVEPDTPIEDIFETDGQYTIVVDVEDGPSVSRELTVRSTTDDADLHQIYIEADRIEFS